MGLPCFASQIGENAGFSGIICDFTGNEWWFERWHLAIQELYIYIYVYIQELYIYMYKL